MYFYIFQEITDPTKKVDIFSLKGNDLRVFRFADLLSILTITNNINIFLQLTSKHLLYICNVAKKETSHQDTLLY